MTVQATPDILPALDSVARGHGASVDPEVLGYLADHGYVELVAGEGWELTAAGREATAAGDPVPPAAVDESDPWGGRHPEGRPAEPCEDPDCAVCWHQPGERPDCWAYLRMLRQLRETGQEEVAGLVEALAGMADRWRRDAHQLDPDARAAIQALDLCPPAGAVRAHVLRLCAAEVATAIRRAEAAGGGCTS